MPTRKAATSRLDKRIQALPDELRDRVIERAAILWDSGVEEARANELAFEMETGQPGAATPSVARAKKRSAESAKPPVRSGTDD
jgi:hypothetical protein